MRSPVFCSIITTSGYHMCAVTLTCALIPPPSTTTAFSCNSSTFYGPAKRWISLLYKDFGTGSAPLSAVEAIGGQITKSSLLSINFGFVGQFCHSPAYGIPSLLLNDGQPPFSSQQRDGTVCFLYCPAMYRQVRLLGLSSVCQVSRCCAVTAK